MTGSDTPQTLRALRTEVRELVKEWRAAGRLVPRCDAWLRGNDEQFTAALADRGWIGVTWPSAVGGAGRSTLARLVITEELLRAGAPVARHWMGDRQIGPAILRYGSPELRQRFLPGIVSGEITFCLGMSETESGSDLASVRTVAERTAGGWRLRGRKIWTSHAHVATHAYVLARTDSSGDKHAGLSEFVVDLASPGVELRPIFDLRGEHHFNEMLFDDVLVPEGQLLGREGNGWLQVTEQLAFERGGMERILTTYPLLRAVLDAPEARAHRAEVGIALARLTTLREMARTIAVDLDAGAAPIRLAAVTKDLGTEFEGDVNELARNVLRIEPDATAEGAARLLADGLLAAPGTTIRGGTTEVLRTIVAKAASIGGDEPRPELHKHADDVLTGRGGDYNAHRWRDDWRMVSQLGWPWVGVVEELNGSGGDLSDLVTFVTALGRHAVPVPLVETAWAAQLLAMAGRSMPPAEQALTVAVPRPGMSPGASLDGSRLRGSVDRVPWAAEADQLLVLVTHAGAHALVAVATSELAPDQLGRGANLAGEPRHRVDFEGVTATLLAERVETDRVYAIGALLRSAALVGTLESALRLTLEHAATREQFNRPIRTFQAVGERIARMTGQLGLAKAATIRAAAAGTPDLARVATAFVIAGRAAGEVARHAHQVHGAMGVTREHTLHLWTRRLWSWRDEFGGDRYWAELLADRLMPLDDDALWDWITSDT